MVTAVLLLFLPLAAGVGVSLATAQAARAQGDPPRVLAWNDLGMHCIDPDFSIFAILPPFNDVNSQLIVNGQVQTDASGYTLTYESIADPTGSINTTSIGKTNFWDFVQALFNVALPPDMGLAGFAMPGPANTPQEMAFHADFNWFAGVGIPFTPRDDAGELSPYPLVKITARNSSGQEVASTITSVPNSEEIACALCHASGSSPFAKPAAGWVYHPNPLQDERLNILRLHDERQQGDPAYVPALIEAQYNPAGLYETVVTDGTPILCARCHGSNALPGTGIAGIEPLTAAMHGLHGGVVTPNGQPLDTQVTRVSCYTCHPGDQTQCLRGAMGKAIGADGDFAMSCQSCHGNQSHVGDPDRVGWLEQPNCQNCHTGTATQNSGKIRFLTVFDDNGNPRVPASTVFATQPDVPAPGFSLYRFSEGHGGLQCSACHGSPHAIYPTAVANDNLQNLAIQGHVGTLTECSACHGQLEDNELAGPHGMHPATTEWVIDKHKDMVSGGGVAQCLACHGADAKGTVLSYAQGDRTYNTPFGVKHFWRGFQISCYACHDGPSDDDPVNNTAPAVSDVLLTTPNDVPVATTLAGTDPNGNPLTLRIVSQPDHGTVALDGALATYLPEPGFLGSTSFTYAAWDGLTNSNLGTVTVEVTDPQCPAEIDAYGFGCPGTGGFMPQASMSGCASPGQSITLEISNGLGGADVYVAVGKHQAAKAMSRGCVLRVAPVTKILGPFHLSGTGGGNGHLAIGHGVPPRLAGSSLTLQAFIVDPEGSSGWTSTNGLEIFFN